MNYQEVTGSAEGWTRCRTVTVHNESGAVPYAEFVEEVVVKIGEQVYTKPGRTLKAYYQHDAPIEIMNPLTGESTGVKITHAELYAAMATLYFSTAFMADEMANYTG